MPTDDQLIDDVKRARAVLRAHLPEPPEWPPSNMFAMGVGYKMEFPDVDRALVTPVIMGREMPTTSVEYRLSWDRFGMVWEPGGIEIRKMLGLPNICATLRVPAANKAAAEEG